MTPAVPTIDWSTIDFTSIFSTFMSAVPYAIPVVIAFIAFKKGYGFIKKQVKGA
jgi:hypothetical protein